METTLPDGAAGRSEDVRLFVKTDVSADSLWKWIWLHVKVLMSSQVPAAQTGDVNQSRQCWMEAVLLKQHKSKATPGVLLVYSLLHGSVSGVTNISE